MYGSCTNHVLDDVDISWNICRCTGSLKSLGPKVVEMDGSTTKHRGWTSNFWEDIVRVHWMNRNDMNWYLYEPPAMQSCWCGKTLKGPKVSGSLGRVHPFPTNPSNRKCFAGFSGILEVSNLSRVSKIDLWVPQHLNRALILWKTDGPGMLPAPWASGLRISSSTAFIKT